MTLPAGAYQPGTSPLHRAPAGLKLFGLAAGCVALVLATTPLRVGVAAACVVLLYALGRIGIAAAWAQVRPLRWFVVVLVVVQLIVADPATAVTMTGRVVVAVALAGVVTVTTRTTDLMDALERGLGPLRRIGVDPTRISLVLSLAIRAVPVVARLAAQVRDAQRARGSERSLRAFAVPLVVSVLSYADGLGDALRARGLDD